MVTVGRFLAGIAALVWRPADGRYLLLQRSAAKDYGAGFWECVTGRVDQGESFVEALHREVREELGERARVQLDFVVGTTHFYRGPADPLNELLGVVFACSLLSEQVVCTSSEHSAHRWLSAGEVLEFVPADYWLHRAVRRAEAIRALATSDLLGFIQKEGLEI